MRSLHKAILFFICSSLALALLTSTGYAVKPYTANGRIFYKSTDDGTVNIASMTVNGQNKTTITDNDGTYDYPFLVISPDGKKLAFIVENQDTSQYSASVINENGSDIEEIIPAGDPPINSLAWSPDGEKIAYNTFNDELGYSQVKTVDVDTPHSTTTLPIDLSGEEHIYQSIQNIAWSVDNNLALILSNDLIYSVNIDGSNLRVLTNDGDWPSSEPTSVAWSPDGEKIVFTADDCQGNNSCIVTMSADGSNKNIIVNRDEKSAYDDRYTLYPVNASWSPDGKKIIFAKKAVGGPFD